MLRSSLATASALILCATAAAQQTLQPVRITSPLKDAGIYHLETGTWTRANTRASYAPTPIFKADYQSGYYGTGWSGYLGVDEGVIPGTGRPSPNTGPLDEYLVDGWQFAYCCSDTALNVEFRWYDAYAPCDDVSTPTSCLNQTGATFLVTGLPVGGCWIVTIDIAGSGYEVCFQAEGGGGTCYPGYDADLNLDSFGWGARYIQPGTAFTGPLLAGYDDTWVTPGRETCYNITASECTPEAVGLGAQDQFAIDELNGCYWFGGYVAQPVACTGCITPPGQFWLVLYVDSRGDCGSGCDTVLCDDPYCGDNNTGSTRLHDCVTGTGLILTHSDMTGMIAGYAMVSATQGQISDPPGATGDLCLGGNIGRYVLDLFIGAAGPPFETDLINGVHGAGLGAVPNHPGVFYATGQTWSFQAWYRIPGYSTFTDATTVTLE